MAVAAALVLVAGAFFTLREVRRPRYNPTPITSVIPDKAPAPMKQGAITPDFSSGLSAAIESAVKNRFEASPPPDTASLTEVATPLMHAVLSTNWDALVSALSSKHTLKHDPEFVKNIRDRWRLLPPRHRPDRLEEMTDMEVLEHRASEFAALESVDLTRVGVRIYDLRDKSQKDAARAEFGRRYRFLYQHEASDLTLSGGFTLTPADLPPWPDFPYSFVADVDVPGRTREGATVILTIRFFYFEGFGWVPIGFEAVTRLTPEAQTPYTPIGWRRAVIPTNTAPPTAPTMFDTRSHPVLM